MHADGRLAKPMMARLTRRGMLRRSVQAWPAPHCGFCLPSIVRAWTGKTERTCRFQELRLATNADRLAAMRAFYKGALHLPLVAEDEETRCNQTTRFHGVS